MYNFNNWTEATANLPWGVQHTLHSSLTLVAEGKISMAWGADYSEGSPCLINSAAQMLQSGGGNGIPSQYFGELVSEFDRLNRHMHHLIVSAEAGKVHPIAAETMLKHFAPLKEKPIAAAVDEATQMEAFANNIHREPSDEEMANDWLNSLTDIPTEDECHSKLTTTEMSKDGSDRETILQTVRPTTDHFPK